MTMLLALLVVVVFAIAALFGCAEVIVDLSALVAAHG
jgi:hypothetical protein